MGEIRVGTCSWTDKALVSSGWYPTGQRDAEGRLRHYATRFPVVEVDSTYYGLPSTRNSHLWTERTPEGFRFDVKAFSLFTGHPTRPEALPADLRPAFLRQRRGPGAGIGPGDPGDPGDPGLLDEVWERYGAALEPLREAGRLGTLVFQFPHRLVPGRPAAEFLRRCRERAAGWPVAVEFRNPGWWREEHADATAALLTELDAATVAVDMTQTLPTSVPPVVRVTSPDLALVRFHGRNTAWGTGTKEERFRHDYTSAELAEWTPRIRELAERAREVHVLFNNCCGDAAVRAAESMRGLLGLS
ncbi:DUF72 domain-containing protein [Streptomyces sp. NPDC007910]|uniref:DUF72 domain-containing protein n=1 Tax=Streptomyces sp. NPDC007910 TaxID=3364790 RepID=UPI0036E13810